MMPTTSRRPSLTSTADGAATSSADASSPSAAARGEDFGSRWGDVVADTLAAHVRGISPNLAPHLYGRKTGNAEQACRSFIPRRFQPRATVRAAGVPRPEGGSRRKSLD